MAEPTRKSTSDITPNLKPDLGAGGSTPSTGRASSKALNTLEQNPSAPENGTAASREQNVAGGSWANKTSTAEMLASTVSGKKGGKSPLIAILILLFGGGFTMAGLFGAMSLLPLNIAARFFEVGDTQNTSFTIRTNLIINNKISKDITASCGNFTLLKCRYERPSNKLLKSLAREGITALDADGNAIDRKALWPNKKPALYEIANPDGGKPIRIKANDFAGALKKNPVMRAAFHRAYTPRFIGYADKIFQSIKKRFGFNASDKFKKSKNGTDVGEKLNDTSAGPSNGAKAAIAAGSEGADEVIKKEITETLTKETKNVAKAGKGNAVGLVAGIACGLADIPGIVIKTVRAYQLVQLIRYGSAIFSAIGAIKAGDATPQEASAIGDLFTQTVGGKSAMESFGMKSILFGDTKPTGDSYKKFIPGASAIGALGAVASATDSQAKREACKYATNPATGAAIDLITSETVIGPLINIAAGVAISIAMEQLLPPAIEFVVGLLSSSGILNNILSFFLGDLTKDLSPDDRGNAFSSAGLNLMGQTANAGANQGMTVAEAVAYENTTKQVQLAYAEEDRATLSPFDATNSNTFLGSLVGQLMPYYSKLSSVSGVFSTIGSIVGGSMSKITGAYAATDDTAKYTMCPDPALTGVAAGPFCNVIYGVPTQYLDKDPEEVMDRLIASGDVNAETGEPIDKTNFLTSFNPTEEATGNLKGWMDLCTDGTTSQTANCMITDDRTSDYALYVIDHRIQQTMDGEDAVLENGTDSSTAKDSAAATATTDATSPVIVVNKKHPLSPVTYTPAGLIDIGGGQQLRQEAATAFNTMKADAAGASNTLTAVRGYVSYDAQKTAYSSLVTSLGQAQADSKSLRPGFSENQTGLAVDINTIVDQNFATLPAGQWLAANSYKYGFILRYPNGKTEITGHEFEPWHYRYIGVGPATEMHTKGVTTLEDYYVVTGGGYAFNLSSMINNVALQPREYSFV